MKPEQKVRLILIGPAVLAIVILSGCFGNKRKSNNIAKKKYIASRESKKNEV